MLPAAALRDGVRVAAHVVELIMHDPVEPDILLFGIPGPGVPAGHGADAGFLQDLGGFELASSAAPMARRSLDQSLM